MGREIMVKSAKKIVFNEELDSKISGVALVLAFLSIGLFLLIVPNYFGNKLVATVIRWIFILIGVLGLMVEIPKNKNNNIKGFDNLILGIVFVGLWAVLFVYINIWWVNVICFFIFLIGLYSLFRGLLEIIYSTAQTIRNNKDTKKSITTDIFLLLTKVLSLILVIIQIIKALGSK